MQQQRATGAAVIQVDSGDYFFKDLYLMQHELNQLKSKAEILAQGLKIMGYDVVCPGENDFATGLTGYRELIKKATGVTVICANLKSGNELAFPATTIRTVNGVRVGFLGILSVPRPLPSEGGKPLLLDDPIVAGQKAVAALKKEGVDAIIALTHQGYELDQAFAKKVPGIDYIVGGHSREMFGMGVPSDKTSIHIGGAQGKNHGFFKFRIGPKGAKGEPGVVTRLSAELVPMDTHIKDEPVLAKAVKEYHDKVAAENKAKSAQHATGAQRVDDGGEVFWGAALCGQCHVKQDLWWKSTVHSHAYETLVKAKKQFDLECLACHTTGFAQTRNRPSYHSITDVAGIESVQCEACHGAGSHHNTPEIRQRALRKDTCTGCHNPKQSPKFDFPTWLPRMACPKGS